MNVKLRIRFDPPTEEDWQAAGFTMPTEAQDKAVDKIDRALRFGVENRQDSTISFPRTAAEEARARRKNERRKALRKPRQKGE